MTSIFDQSVSEAIANMDKEIIKGVEFEAGLTLQFIAVEKKKGGQFGAAEDSSIVERGVLEEGEQFLYTFKDEDGFTRKLYSTSFPFCIEMEHAELAPETWIKITRTGKLKETKYEIVKTEV